MPNDMKPICEFCKWWSVEDVKDGIGACHRYPPTIIVNDEEPDWTQYPRTGSDEWCGEWELK